MLRRIVFLLLSVLAFAGPSYAAITCNAGDFVFNSATGATTLTITFTVPSQTYRRPVIGFQTTTNETATVNSVADDNGGTWTQRAGPEDLSTVGTSRAYFYEQSTLGGTGSTTVTVTWGSSVDSSGVAGTCYSDTASLDYVSSSTPYAEFTSTSPWTSGSRTFTATGVMFGDFYSSGGNCDISSVGTNQTELTSPTGSRRAQMIVRKESSGSYTIDATLAFNCSGQLGAHLYQEATAAASSTGRLLLLGVGN